MARYLWSIWRCMSLMSGMRFWGIAHNHETNIKKVYEKWWRAVNSIQGNVPLQSTWSNPPLRPPQAAYLQVTNRIMEKKTKDQKFWQTWTSKLIWLCRTYSKGKNWNGKIEEKRWWKMISWMENFQRAPQWEMTFFVNKNEYIFPMPVNFWHFQFRTGMYPCLIW